MAKITDKIDLIIENEKQISKNEKQILTQENKILDYEENNNFNSSSILNKEKEVISNIKELESDLQNRDTITKLTLKDLSKGFIGAFSAILSAFTFSKGFDISSDLSIFRASILLLVGYLIIIIVLYHSGFKKIKKKVLLKILPLRAILLYFISIITIIMINVLFGLITMSSSFLEIYKIIAINIIIATIGASVANLIGKN